MRFTTRGVGRVCRGAVRDAEFPAASQRIPSTVFCSLWHLPLLRAIAVSQEARSILTLPRTQVDTQQHPTGNHLFTIETAVCLTKRSIGHQRYSRLPSQTATITPQTGPRMKANTPPQVNGSYPRAPAARPTAVPAKKPPQHVTKNATKPATPQATIIPKIAKTPFGDGTGAGCPGRCRDPIHERARMGTNTSPAINRKPASPYASAARVPTKSSPRTTIAIKSESGLPRWRLGRSGNGSSEEADGGPANMPQMKQRGAP